MKKLSVFALAVLFLLDGCSVNMAADKQGAMAADKQGVNFDDLNKCKTRACLIAHGAEPLRTGYVSKDTEEFMVQKKAKESKGQLVTHGLLDVATLGIWELAEVLRGHYDNVHYIRVTYDSGTTNIKSIVLRDKK